ncbi:unnamed protein product [Peniophora sp. CBMAI 1063]|nr:unnamed protein product [Peniophora sp. CBMAI 1063]
MSMPNDGREWEPWLWLPDHSAVDSHQEIYNTISADYSDRRVSGLLATIELRLAEVFLYFDDVAADPRIVSAIRSELNFLRAVLGEVRLGSHELPPSSAFLQRLQDAVDGGDWTFRVDILAEAKSVTVRQDSRSLLDQEPYSFPLWWTTLPREVSRIQADWLGFDLADVVIALSFASVAPPESLPPVSDGLASLDTELERLANDFQPLINRMAEMEDAVAKGVEDQLRSHRAR